MSVKPSMRQRLRKQEEALQWLYSEFVQLQQAVHLLAGTVQKAGSIEQEAEEEKEASPEAGREAEAASEEVQVTNESPGAEAE